MGMAASQARFLNLTARKTNIEYQGQQINQQRTALSNKSADLYNQMLTLSVPTPPNTQDYTKVTYSFMMPGGVDEATISQFAEDSSGTYTVSFAYKNTELGFNACTDSEKPAVANSTASITNPSTGSGNITVYQVTLSNGKSYYAMKSSDFSTADQAIHTDAVNKVKTQTGHNNDTIYIVDVGTAENPSYQYYSGTELGKCVGANATQSIATYWTAGDVVTYKEDTYSKCTINRDKYNRVQSFTTNGTTFAVTTKTLTDDEAYNDAMNEYTYKSYMYEQEMAEINAMTSIIQAQDRELELKLKQLDTEHNAVQTEIEAVQGVCKKNTEDSFKIFA